MFSTNPLYLDVKAREIVKDAMLIIPAYYQPGWV